jgi:hypothetical protein
MLHNEYPKNAVFRNATVNRSSEHAIYMTLFISNGGGW